MSTYLYRLGAMAFDHRRKVLAAWLAVIVAVIAAAFAFGGKTNNSFSVPGTESQQAQDLLEAKFPAASGAYARMVFAAPEGTTLADPEVQAAVMASVEQAGSGAEVISVMDPYSAGTISADGSIGFADVRYAVPAEDIEKASKDQLEASAEPAEAAGVDVEWAGGVIKSEAEAGSEAIGMMIGFLVLAITLTSLLAAGLPLLSAAIGVVVGMMGLTAVTGVVEVSDTARPWPRCSASPSASTTPCSSSRATARACTTASPRASPPPSPSPPPAAPSSSPADRDHRPRRPARVNIPFLTVMGLAAAGTVATAVLIAITLLPPSSASPAAARAHEPRARLQRPPARPREPDRLDPLGDPRHPPPAAVRRRRARADADDRRPRDAHEARPPDDGSQPTNTTERKAYDLLTEGFGPGFNGPLTLVIDGQGATPEEQAAIANQVVEGLEGTPGVAAVSAPVPNEAGDLTVLSVTPTTSPSSDETKDLVD
jgi:RND superfamily putative drug exporter